ncbi:MAG TPA: aldehyde dehydrogenase family protein, partial [Nitrospirota bacterium]|nr:aldehyde dehydrogenase family protein [Nitrospirota bacterium]
MDFLRTLGIEKINSGASTGTSWDTDTAGAVLEIRSPVDGKPIASVRLATMDAYDNVVKAAEAAFLQWRMVPAPKRGEIVRQIGQRLRMYKESLGMLVSYEMGKSLQEGLGEVQEMIDICDFAVGQSRMLYGFTMHSERERHRMYEQ